MRRPPSKPPPSNEPEKLIVKLDKPCDATPSGLSDFGLSNAQLNEVIKAMEVAVRRVGCPVHGHPLEVVNDAFVMVLSKPISDRPSSAEWGKFVASMCTFAIHAALTNRKSKHRRLLSEGHADEQLASLLAVAGQTDAVDARVDLEKVFSVLNPEDQELLKALYFEDKTIQEFAVEKGVPWTTIKSRTLQALNLLYAALQALIAAIVLLFPKNARAQGARLAQHVSRLVPHATQTAAAMTVTVACGVIMPASSMATVEHHEVPVAMLVAAPKPTFAASMAPAAPPVTQKVEPVKPITLDELQKQWSSADMNSFKIARYLQATMFPFAFLSVPAVSQVACAGAEHRTTPPQETEELDESADPYEQVCAYQTRRGQDCPTRKEWYGSMGRCPDGKKGCQ